MSDSVIRIVSDYESDISSAVGTWVSPYSYSHPISHDRVGHKVVSLTSDFDSERVSGNSLDEKASSLDSFAALLSDDDAEEGHDVVLIPLSHFVYCNRRTYNRKASDVEIKTHMEHKGRTNVVFFLKPDKHFRIDELFLRGVTLVESDDARKCDWVAVEVVGTPSIINNKADIDGPIIMVSDSSH